MICCSLSQFVPSRRGRARPQNKIISLHAIHAFCTNCRHMPWFCLSRTSFGIPRPGCLRPRVRKVTAMRYRRDVLDVLSLVDQLTVDLSVCDTSVNVASIANGARLGQLDHAVGPRLKLASGFSIGG
jgi:hypothetical protein